MIKEKEGYRYSLKPFDGYLFRAKFVLEMQDGKQEHNTDVYTDNTDRDDVEYILMSAMLNKYDSKDIFMVVSGVVHWSLKEQDEVTRKFIEETLKDW